MSTASGYEVNGRHVYNGCGWIASLQNELKKVPTINLGIAFFTRSGQVNKSIIENITYYPLKDPYSSKLSVFLSIFRNKSDYDAKRIALLLKSIYDFNSDIIQVFGTEDVYGGISIYTKIPVVLHLQGILNPYYVAFLPPFMSWSLYPKLANNLKHKIIRYNDRRKWKYACKREEEIFKNIKYYMGRTEWDKKITKLYNKNALYYECWEVLRQPFYDTNVIRTIPNKLTIVSTISNTSYKGFDLVLKTALLLKQFFDFDFEWLVYGGINSRAFESLLDISAKENNIYLMGIATAEQLKEQLVKSTVYVHPSYIDNSPNSICEAMILGCPVIACNVGGVPSLIDDQRTGFLVPANDPFQMTYWIKKIYDNQTLNRKIGDAARKDALERHNINKICLNVISVYEAIVDK